MRTLSLSPPSPLPSSLQDDLGQDMFLVGPPGPTRRRLAVEYCRLHAREMAYTFITSGVLDLTDSFFLFLLLFSYGRSVCVVSLLCASQHPVLTHLSMQRGLHLHLDTTESDLKQRREIRADGTAYYGTHIATFSSIYVRATLPSFTIFFVDVNVLLLKPTCRPSLLRFTDAF